MKRRDIRMFRRETAVPVEDFWFVYDGPAVADGRVPVRDLAPALIALGDLFQIANEVIEPSAPAVRLEVRAFNDGSFRSALSAATDVIEAGLLSDPAIALSTLVTLITDPAKGVFGILRMIKGRIIGFKRNADGSTTITTETGNVYNFPQAQNSVITIIENAPARNAAAAVTKELRDKPGLDEIRIERPNQEPLVITKGEAQEMPEWAVDMAEPEPLNETEFEAVLIPLQPTLDPRYMARFMMAGSDQIIRARIEDETYWRRIHSHEEGFLEGDTMRVRLRMKQWPPEADKPTEWTVLEVISHKHPEGRAVPLPFQEPDEET